MFGSTPHNFATREATTKSFHPKPEPIPDVKPTTASTYVQWLGVAKRLQNNPGYTVQRITQRDSADRLRRTGPLFATPKAVSWASRILENSINDKINWFTLVDTRYSGPLQEVSLPQDTFREWFRKTDRR
jgi:hypothetical protein